MKKNRKKAVVLISGGLDSTIALYKAMGKYNVVQGIFFNYGQKAYESEKEACKKLCRKLKIKFMEIDISFISKFSASSLTKASKKIPKLNEKDLQKRSLLIETASSVMVQNRNMIFISIGASISAEFGCEYLIAGFNKEEAVTFPDNSENFIKSINETLKISLKPKKVKVISPTMKMNKKDMIKYAISHKIDLSTIYSCYIGNKKMCGKCESCIRLKNALGYFKNSKILKINI